MKNGWWSNGVSERLTLIDEGISGEMYLTDADELGDLVGCG
jgi:hypothetical protein